MTKEQANQKCEDMGDMYFETFGQWMAASGFIAALKMVVDEYYGDTSSCMICDNGETQRENWVYCPYCGRKILTA